MHRVHAITVHQVPVVGETSAGTFNTLGAWVGNMFICTESKACLDLSADVVGKRPIDTMQSQMCRTQSKLQR